jgi:hypothetical protein
MSRNKRVQAYVTKAVQTELDKLAEQNDMTRSEYMARVLEKEVHEQQMGEISEQQNLEQRLEALIANRLDETDEAVASQAETTALGAVYSIALWKLINDTFGPQERKEALETARNRLTDDLVRMGIDPDALVDEPDTDHRQRNQTQTRQSDDSDDEYSPGWDFS